jgi:integration host factor subunit alpha
MTLTKMQLVELITENNGFAKNKSIEILENLIEIIKHTLESGEDVLVSGFGKFCVKNKSKRRGRNPATGSDLMLPARKVVTFKCSGKLKDKINKEKRAR